MKMNKIYGLCAVQLIGVGVQLMNRVAGSMIVFLGVIGIILFVAREDMEHRKYKTCPKCKAQILKKHVSVQNVGTSICRLYQKRH